MVHLHRLINSESPDLILLQETKCIDDLFPHIPGYTNLISGQKSYNGVAILVKETHSATKWEVITIAELDQKRYIEAVIDDLTYASVYVPCGGGDLDKFMYKLKFLEELASIVKNISTSKIVIGGDWNVALHDADVQHVDRYIDSVLCVPPVRERFARILDLGLTQEGKTGDWTWWDYRSPMSGLRLDCFLTANQSGSVRTLTEYRRTEVDGVKPSDHVPVIFEF